MPVVFSAWFTNADEILFAYDFLLSGPDLVGL